MPIRVGVLAQAPQLVPPGWKDCWATSFCEDGLEGRCKGIAHKGPRGDFSMNAQDVMAALPDRTCLGRRIEVWYQPVGSGDGFKFPMYVYDLGPHNGAKVADSDYTHGDQRCKAEAQYAAYLIAAKGEQPCPPEGKDDQGRPVTNPAGLDLSWAAWARLGVPANRVQRFSAWVFWRYVDLEV